MNFRILFVLLLSIIFLTSGIADEVTNQGLYKTNFQNHNDSQMLRWNVLATHQNNADAQFYLGVIFNFGNGVTQNIAIALEWYRSAADQGHVDAQYALGEMYYYGEGIPKDSAEALKWFRLAAVQGDADAQYHLGRIYSEKRGEAHNLVQAHLWFNIAASSDKSQVQELATIEREILALWMTSRQIRQAKTMATEWLKRIPRN